MVDKHVSLLIDLPRTPPSLGESEALCADLASSHYENFTVASRLVPRRMRRHVCNLYAFCRTADDIGDEAPGNRNALLDRLEQELDYAYNGTPRHPVLVALRNTIDRFDLPQDLLARLIAANRVDQAKTRYQTLDELLRYCENSATPVGRLFLMLFSYRDAKLFALSDATCIALQLTNFWQDVRRDYEIGRIYLPLDDMANYEVSENDLAASSGNDHFKALMHFEVERTRRYFREGLPLIDHLRGHLRVDVALFSRGGIAILDEIARLDYDTLATRPTLTGRKKAFIFLSTLMSRKWRRWI